MGAIVGVVTAIIMTYQISAAMLDRPIRSIQVNGPFQRVTALQIEEAISDDLDYGFLSADLSEIQQKVVALPWIDHASVSRRWPSKIVISVTEQVPAACWGERGLLNTRGELFVTNATHVPAELPRLSGPKNQAAAVARSYLEIRDQLIPLGLDVRELQVDDRGAWDLTLQNGINIRLCKGAYKEPPDQAYPDKADVDEAFDRLTAMMIDHAVASGAKTSAPKNPPVTAVASHDEKRIEFARTYAEKVGLPRQALEFQMLHGIRSELQQALVMEGYPVRVYIPYGTEWYPYFMRRLAERPANLWFFLSNYFRR